MNNFQYVEVLPANQKTSYGEYEVVDFQINFEGKKIMPNFKISADLEVANVDGTKNIFMDRVIGSHALFSQFTVETENQGILETFSNYPKYCKMLMETTTNNMDLFNSEHCVEMKTQTDEFMKQLLVGPKLMNDMNAGDNDQNDAGVDVNLDFTMKPNICLNRISGVNGISFKKTGNMILSLKLERNSNVFYGVDNTTKTVMVNGNAVNYIPATYSLSNLKLCYSTFDDDGQNSNMVMKVKTNIKQSISSQLANISTTVPLQNVLAFHSSFLKQDSENSFTLNTTQNEVLPDIKNLELLYNNSQDKFVNYQIKTRDEIMYHYIKSFKDTGHNQASLSNLQSNKAYGIGYKFDTPINFQQQKFSLQIQSNINSNTPYVIYLFFSGLISV